MKQKIFKYFVAPIFVIFLYWNCPILLYHIFSNKKDQMTYIQDVVSSYRISINSNTEIVELSWLPIKTLFGEETCTKPEECAKFIENFLNGGYVNKIVYSSYEKKGKKLIYERRFIVLDKESDVFF